jgi:hypothetical protein
MIQKKTQNCPNLMRLLWQIYSNKDFKFLKRLHKYVELEEKNRKATLQERLNHCNCRLRWCKTVLFKVEEEASEELLASVQR